MASIPKIVTEVTETLATWHNPLKQYKIFESTIFISVCKQYKPHTYTIAMFVFRNREVQGYHHAAVHLVLPGDIAF